MAALFLVGGTLGSSGILLFQWVMGRFDRGRAPEVRDYPSEVARLRADVHELENHLANVDARLDFAEKLLGGALTISPAPTRIPTRERRADSEPLADPAPDPSGKTPQE